MVTVIGKGIALTREELKREQPLAKGEGARAGFDIGPGGGSGGFRIALGGVSMSFKKEIKPMQGFEVWTRILTWDRKWLYVIGHFVKPGSVSRPREWLLQPWKNRKTQGQDEEKERMPVIFASGISKYCFKYGRLTIPPERVLQAAKVLPPKPAEHKTPPVSETPDLGTVGGDATAAIPAVEEVGSKAAESLTVENATEVLAASLKPEQSGDDQWDWERVENERLRGMKVAELYRDLDKLNDEFNGHEGVVLGQY